MFKNTKILLVGDAIILASVTLYGLVSHQISTNMPARFASTFLPWLLAWLIIGFFADLFKPNTDKLTRAVARAFLGIIIASPLAGLFRGVILGEDIVIVFVVVFGGLSAILISIWRAIFHQKIKGRLLDG